MYDGIRARIPCLFSGSIKKPIQPLLFLIRKYMGFAVDILTNIVSVHYVITSLANILSVHYLKTS